MKLEAQYAGLLYRDHSFQDENELAHLTHLFQVTQGDDSDFGWFT